MSLASTSWPITSMVGTKTSKLNWPLRSLEIASLIVLKVVSSTLHLYFLPKLSRSFWLT